MFTTDCDTFSSEAVSLAASAEASFTTYDSAVSVSYESLLELREFHGGTMRNNKLSHIVW